MISSKQLEAFYERYQQEGVPNGLSMQAFCSMHNVPYNCFERHVKQRAKFRNIQAVNITDVPVGNSTAESGMQNESGTGGVGHREKNMDNSETSVRILVSIKMSNGFQIHRSNIDYRTLLGLVEKMEVLC